MNPSIKYYRSAPDSQYPVYSRESLGLVTPQGEGDAAPPITVITHHQLTLLQLPKRVPDYSVAFSGQNLNFL
jgi:hypothetical protein